MSLWYDVGMKEKIFEIIKLPLLWFVITVVIANYTYNNGFNAGQDIMYENLAEDDKWICKQAIEHECIIDQKELDKRKEFDKKFIEAINNIKPYEFK